jgi:hypothetical protein
MILIDQFNFDGFNLFELFEIDINLFLIRMNDFNLFYISILKMNNSNFEIV